MCFVIPISFICALNDLLGSPIHSRNTRVWKRSFGLIINKTQSSPTYFLIDDGTGPTFFGYMGIAAALVFCSKKLINSAPLFLWLISLFETHYASLSNRPRCCLRYCQVRCRHLQHGCPQARPHLQVHRTNYHGGYLGYLWFDRRSYPQRKK